MTDYRTAGRTLALNAAATTDDDELQNLVQGHIDSYGVQDLVLILAHALGSIAGFVARPLIDATDDPAERRNNLRHAALALVHGPTETE